MMDATIGVNVGFSWHPFERLGQLLFHDMICLRFDTESAIIIFDQMSGENTNCLAFNAGKLRSI